MRSPDARFGLLRLLSASAVVTAMAYLAPTTAAEAQMTNRGFSVGPRTPMIRSMPTIRSHEPRFHRLRRLPDKRTHDDVASQGKDSAGPTDRPGRRPPRRPPGRVPGVVPGVIIGTIGPALALPPPRPPDAFPPPPPPPGAGPAPGKIHIPPSNERRVVDDELVIEFAADVPPQAIAQVLARHGLTQLELQRFALTDSILVRVRVPRNRALRTALRNLGGEGAVRFGQANFLYRTMQQPGAVALPLPRPRRGATFTPPETAIPRATPAVASASARPVAGDPAQYALAKLRVPQAHKLATGERVLVAVIDSGVDAGHPELAGVISGTYDALGKAEGPHPHGTAMVGAIASRARLMGVAPAASVLAIRAFGKSGTSAEATTFAILKGIEHAVEKGARVVNMSFAGPADPGLSRHLAAASAKGTVLIAASGNLGAKAPPQYPAADPNVIAVSATDARDNLFRAAVRGNHIDVAAPGVDILVPAPNADYQLTSGTSVAAAQVSGIAALMLQRRPSLKPDEVRQVLTASAKDIGPRGRDAQFGAGLVDAYGAVTAIETETARAPAR